MGYSTQGAAYPCRANPWHVVTHGTCETIWFVPFILVGAVRKLQTYELRGTVMPRLLEVADLCSSTVSDTANRLLKRTDSEGSSSVAEKKSSAVPLFRSGHM